MKHLLLFLSLLLVVGCASPYARFYNDTTGGIDVTTHPAVIQSSTPPQLLTGSNQDEDMFKMLEDGYEMIGYSSFNAGSVSDSQAIMQANRTHAHVVLVYKTYTGTRSGSIPLTMPDTKTTTSSYSGNVYGYGGSASYYGSGTSTTYGTKTTYFPYSVDMYDYFATFWVKTDTSKLSLGVRWEDLSYEQRQAIGSNKGVRIFTVIKGTPAFFADLLRGDVLKKINGDEVYDVKDANEKIQKYAGQRVVITLMRNGDEISKEVQLR